jgi:hypothetical protein
MTWRRPVNYRQPSRGPRYTRCPMCGRQVYGVTRRDASGNQINFDLSVALARHKREAHPEHDDDED